MRKIALSFLVIILGLTLAGSANADSLQSQAPADSGNASPEASSSIGYGLLQPVAGYQLSGASGSLGTSGYGDLQASGSIQALGTSTGLSNQEIMGEADPNPPANHSSHWEEITFFALLGLAIIVSGYLLFRRFQPVEAGS